MTVSTARDLMAAALDCAARRWRVGPLHTPDPGAPRGVNARGEPTGGCSCRKADCENQGKHPRTFHGVTDFTTDPDEIRRWWRMWPEANVGVATGDGLVVLDVDPRHGGDRSLIELEEGHGDVVTLAARTGGGGVHLYLEGDLPARNSFRPGLDLKGSGGFVVAPPSLHKSGN